jgi:hypothetical protein
VLAKCENVNVKGNSNETVLHLLACKPETELIEKVLFYAPAIDILAKDSMGRTAAQCAFVCKEYDNMNLLQTRMQIVDPPPQKKKKLNKKTP